MLLSRSTIVQTQRRRNAGKKRVFITTRRHHGRRDGFPIISCFRDKMFLQPSQDPPVECARRSRLVPKLDPQHYQQFSITPLFSLFWVDQYSPIWSTSLVGEHLPWGGYGSVDDDSRNPSVGANQGGWYLQPSLHISSLRKRIVFFFSVFRQVELLYRAGRSAVSTGSTSSNRECVLVVHAPAFPRQVRHLFAPGATYGAPFQLVNH